VADSGVPLVKVDRGGQITYHGPGQIVAYLLLDLRRRKLMVRTLVTRIEEAVIETLAAYNLASRPQGGAPGIYVASGVHEGAKIAALGLKIRNGCSYHGLSLNVSMDLEPFSRSIRGYAASTVDMARWRRRTGASRRRWRRAEDGNAAHRQTASRPHDPAAEAAADPATHGLRRQPPQRGWRCGADWNIRMTDVTANPREPGRSGRDPCLRPTAKQKAQAKTARIPIKVIPIEKLKKPDWIRVKAATGTSRFYEIKTSCASTTCIPCARKRAARTSANASARAPRRS
jgi:lipoate-protein ligase B